MEKNCMEFTVCQVADLEKLQNISQITYKQAFNGLLGEANVNEYTTAIFSRDNLAKELQQANHHFIFIENATSSQN